MGRLAYVPLPANVPSIPTVPTTLSCVQSALPGSDANGPYSVKLIDPVAFAEAPESVALSVRFVGLLDRVTSFCGTTVTMPGFAGTTIDVSPASSQGLSKL